MQDFIGAQSHHLWQSPTSNISEPLFRLRVSVLKDNEGQGDCPSQIFAFRNATHLRNACEIIASTFGDSFSGYTVKNLGFDPPALGEDNVEDGRTQAVTINFDSIDANESWKEFRARLALALKEWERDIESKI